MSNTSLIVITAFVAIFVQAWFVVFLYKTHISMLKQKWETTHISNTMTLSEILHRNILLYEYKESVHKFMRRIHNISLIVNLAITSTVIFFIVG